MAYLDIDTDVLRSSVATAEQANASISEALSLLNQVVIHNDWQCKERYQINENTLANCQTAQEIQNHASSFYQAVKQVSEQFDEAEQNNIGRVNQVDGLLGQILTVAPGIMEDLSSPTMVSFDQIKRSLEE